MRRIINWMFAFHSPKADTPISQGLNPAMGEWFIMQTFGNEQSSQLQQMTRSIHIVIIQKHQQTLLNTRANQITFLKPKTHDSNRPREIWPTQADEISICNCSLFWRDLLKGLCRATELGVLKLRWKSAPSVEFFLFGFWRVELKREKCSEGFKIWFCWGSFEFLPWSWATVMRPRLEVDARTCRYW